jgi:hypothetical protein
MSCKPGDNPREIHNEQKQIEEYKANSKKDNFENRFSIDTTLVKKYAFDHLIISNAKESDSILSLCHCKKYKKDNRIKIQLTTAIPTKKQLDTVNESFNKRNRLLQLRDLGYLTTIDGQFKFLTIVLKDSIIESIDLYSKSTDKEYNGTDFDSLSIDRYKINISKFDYSIASNVYGNFELRLKKEFGLFENDTIFKGVFLCNNWVISEKEQIKNWNIKKEFEKRNKNRGSWH